MPDSLGSLRDQNGIDTTVVSGFLIGQCHLRPVPRSTGLAPTKTARGDNKRSRLSAGNIANYQCIVRPGRWGILRLRRLLLSSPSAVLLPTAFHDLNWCLWTKTKMFRPLYRRCAARQFLRPLQANTNSTRSYAAAAAATPPFDWQDPLNAKALFTEEELAIADTAEKYCQERLLPRVLRMTVSSNPISNYLLVTC